MPGTVHEDAAEASMVNAMDRDARYAKFLERYRKELVAKQDHWYFKMIGQLGYGRRAPLCQVHAVVMVNSYIHSGEIVLAELVLRETPGPDASVVENNEKLSRLPSPFKADFDPGPREDGDGVLSWDEPADLGPIGCSGDGSGPCKASSFSNVVFDKGSIPIEVGTTKPSRTLMHLNIRSYGVARWPYESESVFVMMRTIESMNALWKGLGL